MNTASLNISLLMEYQHKLVITHYLCRPFVALREIKRRLYRIIRKNIIPLRLWDFVLAWVFETGNVTVFPSRYAHGRTPLDLLTGKTPDITEYLDFRPYEWVAYKQNAGLGESHLARWLGISHRIGPLMSYWILPESRISILCTTVQPMSQIDIQTDENKQRMKYFDEKIKVKFNASTPVPVKDTKKINSHHLLDIDEEDPEFVKEFNKVISDDSIKNVDEMTPDSYDLYLTMEI